MVSLFRHLPVFLILLALALIGAAFLTMREEDEAMDFAGGAEPMEPEPAATPRSFGAVMPAIAAAQAEGESASLGVAVMRPSGEVLFESNGAQPYALASLAKLYILVAYLDFVAERGELLSREELDSLSAMIGQSANDPAQAFWDDMDSGEQIQIYLLQRRLARLDMPAEPDAWGDAGQSALQLALFLGQTSAGGLLDPDATAYVRSLLGSVVEGQDWGVSAGIEGTGASVLLKNGWYPDSEGWRINSAGLVTPADGREPYVIVILGDGFSTFQGGIDAVERVAAAINSVMLG